MLENKILQWADFIASLPVFSALTDEQRVYFLSALTLVLCLVLLRLSKSKTKKTDLVQVDEQKTTQTCEVEVNFSQGLVQSRGFILGRLADWFSNKSIDEQSALTLEEILISADLGVKTSQKIISNVVEAAREKGELDLRSCLKKELLNILTDTKSAEITVDNHKPLIVLIVGVNGAGKTTTIAKLSRVFKERGNRVLVAAADTFRAAAVAQLKHWADKIGVEIEYKLGENIKPSTVVFDAISRLKKENQDVLIIDTAGRLHNRVNLMNELEAIRKIIEKDHPGAPHETILVLDGSSGQNALQQAREFNQRGPLTGVIVTKLDGTPKGGIVVAIKDELGIPIRYVGLGEGEKDLKIFNAKDFVDALLGDDIDTPSQTQPLALEQKIEPESETAESSTERRVVRKRKESNGH